MAEILVLDDDDETQRLIGCLLVERGHRVATAHRIVEARTLLSQRRFDALVIDGLLPDGQGMAFIAEIRGAEPAAKIIFISSFFRGVEHYRHLTRDLGVARVISKPFSPQEFIVQFETAMQPPPPPKPDPAADAQAKLREQLEALQASYAKALEGKLDALASALAAARKTNAEEELREARHLAHKLHGTAGSYGFPAVSEAAGRIERIVQAAREDRSQALGAPQWEAVEADLASMRRAAGGGPKAVEERAAPAPAALPTTAAAAEAAPRPYPTLPSTTLLVVDDDDVFLAHAARLGEQAMIRVLLARDGEEAARLARTYRIDAAIIDVVLEHDAPAVDVAHALRALPGMHALPLAFISADGSFANRIAAVHAGVSLFLAKPLGQDEFVQAMHQMVAEQEERRPRLLVIDADSASATEIAGVLAHHGYEPHVLHEATRVVDAIEQLRPDLLLIDLALPEVSGFDLCKMVRADPAWTVPLLVITSQTSVDVRVAAYSAGADDFLVRPIVEEELLARVRLRLSQARQLRDRLDRDALTGLLTRRAFLQALSARLGETARRGAPLALCLIDLDHFKHVNDSHGHLAGDRVLAQFGRLLAMRFRGADLRCRWGGEEFVVAFVGETVTAAAEILDRVRQEFSQLHFRSDSGQLFQTSFSAGISGYPLDGQTIDELLRTADQRLYAAKHGGRNRTLTGPLNI